MALSARPRRFHWPSRTLAIASFVVCLGVIATLVAASRPQPAPAVAPEVLPAVHPSVRVSPASLRQGLREQGLTAVPAKVERSWHAHLRARIRAAYTLRGRGEEVLIVVFDRHVPDLTTQLTVLAPRTLSQAGGNLYVETSPAVSDDDAKLLRLGLQAALP